MKKTVQKMNNHVYVLLGLVVIAASFLRLYKLSEYPVGFHIDEASLGYNAYSMLKTGKDEHGNKFPLYIDMFGDNRPSGYHYLSILPVAVFGLNEFATRLPGAVFGILSVPVIFFLTQIISGNLTISLICSLFLAISPWHVVLSRASAETIVALFFILAGFGLLISSYKQKQPKKLILSVLVLGLSYFFYHTPRIFVPVLFMLILGLVFRIILKYGTKYFILIIISGFLLIFLSYFLIFTVSGGSGRFNQVSIFGFPETKLIMDEQIREDGSQGVPETITRLIHNKYFGYSYTFVLNYFEYFTGKFLFLKGGLPKWYQVLNSGLLYIIQFPFIVIGCIYLYFEKDKFLKIPLFWLISAPLVASITTDDVPNIQRAIVMFPALEIISAYGYVKTISGLNRNKQLYFIIISVILLLLSLSYFLHQYTVHGKAHETLYRNNGFKGMILTVREEYNNYDKFIITKTLGGIYPSTLFYMKYDPKTYQDEGSPKDPDFAGFGKFIFTPQFCPSITNDDRFPKTGKVVYINNGTCKIPAPYNQKKILREDGSTAFIIVFP